MPSRPKKSRSSKARKVGTARCAVSVAERSVRRRNKPAERITPSVSPSASLQAGTSGRAVPTKTALRREFNEWRKSLPTKIERETLLTPEWVAESVVGEAERFLNTELPADYVARLAAKAYRAYDRHRHFQKRLRHADGREVLYMFMRHWTCGWLLRERNPLHKQLPESYGQGRRLPC